MVYIFLKQKEIFIYFYFIKKKKKFFGYNIWFRATSYGNFSSFEKLSFFSLLLQIRPSSPSPISSSSRWSPPSPLVLLLWIDHHRHEKRSSSVQPLPFPSSRQASSLPCFFLIDVIVWARAIVSITSVLAVRWSFDGCCLELYCCFSSFSSSVDSSPFSGETNAPLEETRKKIWLVDSKEITTNHVSISFFKLLLI